MLATVRNQGEIVDTFDVRADGLPDAWWTVSPSPNTIIKQAPAAGADIVEGEAVHITLAAAPKTGLVPPVNGLTLAKAADALTDAGFEYGPQPASAGNDWVVIRQDPTSGSKRELGAQVTLAVENRTAAATPTPAVTPTPTTTATPSPGAAAKPAATGEPGAAKTAEKPKAKPSAAADATPPPPLPTDLIFAGATSGQLYRWASPDAKAVRPTSPKYRFESPAETDDGYAAVHVEDDTRRLVLISADGETVAPRTAASSRARTSPR